MIVLWGAVLAAGLLLTLSPWLWPAHVGEERPPKSGRLSALLEEAGFAVEVGAYGLETAVEAIYGDGDLTVAICAEYDALPGIGHGCGHNVIASAGVGAALALAPVAKDAGLRIKLLGTPAEEHGGGKVPMLLAGAWEDVDFSLMVHGMTGEDSSATAFAATAVDRFEVVFHGLTAHAAGMPEHGIAPGTRFEDLPDDWECPDCGVGKADFYLLPE